MNSFNLNVDDGRYKLPKEQVAKLAKGVQDNSPMHDINKHYNDEINLLSAMMDEIKKKIEELVKKITSDKDFAKEFKKDPVTAVEKVLGVDLPNDKINAIIDGVKAKLTADAAKSMMNKAIDFFNNKEKKN